jgi:hypothetical protein
MLGLIDDPHAGFAGGLGFQSMELTILSHGVEIFDLTFESLAGAESFFQDSVINLGSNLGPDVDLTFAYNLVADGSGGLRFRLRRRRRGSRALDLGDDATRLCRFSVGWLSSSKTKPRNSCWLEHPF